jgi:hypothetical protein
MRVAASGLAAGLALGVWWLGGGGDAPGTGAVEVTWKSSAPQAPAAQVAQPVRRSRPPSEQVASRPEPESGRVANVAHPRSKPPADVRRRASFYLDYGIMRRLDELENFEEVMAKGREADDRRS